MLTSDVTIREEQVQDHAAVIAVNAQAFGRQAESRLVEALRLDPRAIPQLSLVAVLDGQVVGHILFSLVMIETPAGEVPILALAPVAVLPKFQSHGVGSALVRHGLERCRQLGYSAVSVLGHPHYYPRFGFRPARLLGIQPPFAVPDEAWMAIELQPGALSGVQGRLRYPAAFDGVD